VIADSEGEPALFMGSITSIGYKRFAGELRTWSGLGGSYDPRRAWLARSEYDRHCQMMQHF
jgi:hypothetical protein